MKNITYDDLYAFVSRADTLKKISIAEKWLKDNAHLTSMHSLDELLSVLEMQRKYLVLTYIEAYEKRIINEAYAISNYTIFADEKSNHYITFNSSEEIIFSEA